MTAFFFNPHAAGGRHRPVLETLSANPDLMPLPTAGPEELATEVRRVAERGDPRVVVAGGDGTLHHAIRGLSGTECALGIVPLGSGNDLARALQLELDPIHAAERALAGTRRRIDLGCVGGIPFAGVAGLGIDSEVNRRVAGIRSKRRGAWVYPYATLRSLLSFQAPQLTIDHDDGRYRGTITIAAMANSPVFGGGMRIAPEAALDDGMLDLVVVEQLSIPQALRLFPKVYRGTHGASPAVLMVRTSRAIFRSKRELTFYADGEPVARCDDNGTTIEVLPGALWVVS